MLRNKSNATLRSLLALPLFVSTTLVAQSSFAQPAPQDASAQPPQPAAAQSNLGSPRAFLDYSDGTFFLRSADDNILIATGGRMHLDTYAFAGPNIASYHKGNGSTLGTTMFFRRFVLESGGIIRKHWFYWLGGNFAPTSVDNNQATTSTSAVYDGFIGYQSSPHFQIYAGQFNAPVTMENVTSSRWLDFMERALVIRTVATPYNKDLGMMLWGASSEGVAPFEYQVGVFGGDGMNRPNEDRRFDGMARVLLRPFVTAKGAIQRAHIGASGRYGSRDGSAVNYDAPALSTPGGYTFWSPTYTLPDKTEIHVMPAGDQTVIGGELYLPFERFDLKSEFVYAREGMREAAANARKVSLRRGIFSGWGGYVQLSVWPLGKPRVNGNPAGRYFGLKPPKDRGAEAPHGLQLLARGETMQLNYNSNALTPEIADGSLSAITTNIRAASFQLAANYWATKHVRLTAEYSLYAFPGSPPAAGADATNQAAAPGAKAATPDPNANLLHEISFRFGLAL